MNAVHASGVLGWIEQSNVTFPHVQAGEPSFCGSFSQDSAGVWLPLNSDNWRVSEDEVGKQSAADSSKEMHGSHFTPHPADTAPAAPNTKPARPSRIRAGQRRSSFGCGRGGFRWSCNIPRQRQRESDVSHCCAFVAVAHCGEDCDCLLVVHAAIRYSGDASRPRRRVFMSLTAGESSPLARGIGPDRQ